MFGYVMDAAGEEVGLWATLEVLPALDVDQYSDRDFAYDSDSGDGGPEALVVGIARTPSLALVVYIWSPMVVIVCLVAIAQRERFGALAGLEGALRTE
jgi:hypothetical protein